MGGLQAFQCDINEWINNGEQQINDDCYGWKSNIFPQKLFWNKYYYVVWKNTFYKFVLPM